MLDARAVVSSLLAALAACSGNPSTPDVPDAPALPMAGGEATFRIQGRSEDRIVAVLPENRPAKPPLLLAFHSTGGEPTDMLGDFGLEEQAAAKGFVAIAPRAGYREPATHPADVDHSEDGGGSSWNMWEPGADENEDLLYVRALISAAARDWDADTSRVYTLGFSNGAFFSYFVAASMPDRIAGFAENSGGWTTDACPTRYDRDDNSLYPMGTTAPAGAAMTCAQIFADPAFPTGCRVGGSNRLRPPTPGGRTPFGFLGHYSVDDVVSVAWSCLLAESMGGRAQTMIRAADSDGTTTGHIPMLGFLDAAWTSFDGRTVKD